MSAAVDDRHLKLIFAPRKLGVVHRSHLGFVYRDRLFIKALHIILYLRIVQRVCQCAAVDRDIICRRWQSESVVLVGVVFVVSVRDI